MAERGWEGGSPDSQLGLLPLESSINSWLLDTQPSGRGEGLSDKRPPFCIECNVKIETPNTVTFAYSQVDPKVDHPDQDTFGLKRDAVNNNPPRQ